MKEGAEQKFKNPLFKAFGVFLADRRKKQNMDASDLAEKLGITPGHYRLIECGVAALQPYAAIKLIPALHTLPIDFIHLSTWMIFMLSVDGKNIDEFISEAKKYASADPRLTALIKAAINMHEPHGRYNERKFIDLIEKFLTTPTPKKLFRFWDKWQKAINILGGAVEEINNVDKSE
jgi:transcriptional regulator with XRE-family HTH domain